MPECVRNRASLPPEGTPLQQTATWPGPPKDPPVEVGEMEVEDAKPDLEFDANHLESEEARDHQKYGKLPHKDK